MRRPYTIMVVTISLHFAPYSMDLRFFCLALNGAGRRPQHAENWAERMCSSQTAKPREEPCTCFSNYHLDSFEDISRDGAYNSGIALFNSTVNVFDYTFPLSWYTLSSSSPLFLSYLTPYLSPSTLTLSVPNGQEEYWMKNGLEFERGLYSVNSGIKIEF